jgi:CheY-like chemotaxis protein
MNTVFLLSNKQLVTNKDESTLAKQGILFTKSSNYSLVSEYSIKAGKLDYNVVVIDDSLHGTDPYKTCRRLRDSSKATIILLGDKPPKEMWDKCKEIGFDQYYKKPMSSGKLTKQIIKTIKEQKPKEESVATALNAPNSCENNTDTVATEARAVPTTTQISSDVSKAVDNSAGMWHDPKAASLISGFLKGKINQLTPGINLGIDEGYSYSEAERMMGTSGKETVIILETLAKQGLLIKKDFEKMLAGPDGEVQMLPMETCPNCDSSDLTRGQLVEHFNCGHIGLEEEFINGSTQICPKCHRELKLIGTDYRKPGMRYVCNRCHGIFPTPMIKSRSLKTGKIYPLEDLHYVYLYTYSLNETHRQKLEFELEPKKQLIDYLVRLGYKVQESAEVQGRSGATHKIDIVATMDDIITSHSVAIGILAGSNDGTEVPIEPLFNFDSRIYDTGIDGKMVIAVPRFNSEAMKFAERQGIRVYNLVELRDLLSWKAQVDQMVDVNEKEQQVESVGKPDNGEKLDPRAWLTWLLRNRGYNVEEKLKVTGRSGAEHTLDFFAQKDDGIINHKLAACIITTEDVFDSDANQVMQFDTAAYDVGIRDKIVVSVPTLSKEASQFAQYQRIKIIKAKELIEFTTKPKIGNLVKDSKP